MRVTYAFTSKCNYTCGFCGYRTGPEGNTASLETSKAIFGNLSADTSVLTFTGGEPLFVREALYDILEFIRSDRTNILPPNCKIMVSTNGYWLKDPDEAYTVIKELNDFGVNTIWLSGFTKYHVEQARLTQKWDCNEIDYQPHDSQVVISALDRLGRETGIDDLVAVTSRPHGRDIRPKASRRARGLPQGEVMYACSGMPDKPCDYQYGIKGSVTIDEKGDVYLCCWAFPPSIGSAISTPIDELIDRAETDQITIALKREGPLGVAKYFGLVKPGQEAEYIDKCICKCADLFRTLRASGLIDQPEK